MRTPKIIFDFVRWRWAPTVALSLGALSYVALAVLLIPERIGDSAGLDPGTARGASFAARIGSTTTDETSTAVADVTPARPAMDMAPAPEPVGMPERRGFSPPLPRPEAPPPMPMPMPEQAPPPPPEPTPAIDVMAPPVPTNLDQIQPPPPGPIPPLDAIAAPLPPDPNAMPAAPDPNAMPGAPPPQ